MASMWKLLLEIGGTKLLWLCSIFFHFNIKNIFLHALYFSFLLLHIDFYFSLLIHSHLYYLIVWRTERKEKVRALKTSCCREFIKKLRWISELNKFRQVVQETHEPSVASIIWHIYISESCKPPCLTPDGETCSDAADVLPQLSHRAPCLQPSLTRYLELRAEAEAPAVEQNVK